MTRRMWRLRFHRFLGLWARPQVQGDIIDKSRGFDTSDRTRHPYPGPKWADLLFACLDLLGVCDLYEATTNLLSPSLRELTMRELHVLRPIFGDSVPYHLIRIDERAHLGPRQKRFCYVSFHTINSWGPMADATLVHEVVHVWQYLHRGACYIPRALYAQRTPMGYNYGGLMGLSQAASLEDFNYEQQADVIEDAWRLANGWPGQWVPGCGAECLGAYGPFLTEILGEAKV